MIYVLAKFTVHTEHRAAFLEHSRKVIAETVKEPGCIAYDVAESTTNTNSFTSIEQWETREALGRHFETPHLKEWARILVPMTATLETDVIHSEKIEKLQPRSAPCGVSCWPDITLA
ncbi:putative quinol monooxygenase [Mesorhizobium sp. XAP10]|uniref:putative quinol monooxygenase n=1 Tax=unclassified Mesorhizobium TaxID=325217 RepID=UPI0023DEA5A9|nr:MULTISPECIES: putative quinol monooxygenase [unclassified Mesorhizobium]MDF3154541.1 putative quinol monooxygenase [Mesorhizobium sp. XAP10]MDF3247909.1 putative quinol monooxygenase [Mesorhizobium sp. XAP4]